MMTEKMKENDNSSAKAYDVFAIGSALVDILVEIDDSSFSELNLTKGAMTLIDRSASEQIHNRITNLRRQLTSGGSSANVLAGLANLGGSAVFCGIVGDDEHGLLFSKEMTTAGVRSHLSKSSSSATGHAITFITSDFERSFATHLGASLDFRMHHVFDEDLKKSRIVLIEGYQLEDPNLREASLHAMQLAKDNGIRVAVDLADASLIRRNLADMQSIMKTYANIIFANEFETAVFTGIENPEQALDMLTEFADIAIVKLGSKGSLIGQGSKRITVGAYPATVRDTTGAGDLYAAGFLYGLTHGYSLERCGRLGSFTAAKVIEVLGAKLPRSLKEEIENI